MDSATQLEGTDCQSEFKYSHWLYAVYKRYTLNIKACIRLTSKYYKIYTMKLLKAVMATLEEKVASKQYFKKNIS